MGWALHKRLPSGDDGNYVDVLFSLGAGQGYFFKEKKKKTEPGGGEIKAFLHRQKCASSRRAEEG